MFCLAGVLPADCDGGMMSRNKFRVYAAMTKQARYNLLGVITLPVAAVIAAAIATANGVFNAYGATYVFLFALNCAVTIPAALISALLLRSSEGELARWVAILPTWVPVIYGSVWYIWRAVFPAKVAAGAEYIGALQYLLIALLLVTFVVVLLRLTRLVPRTA